MCVHGAAGGVGLAGVQLAVAAGAQVVATVRNADLRDAVAAFGAEVCAPEEFTKHGPYDVVLELIGAPNFPANLDALALNGRIVVIGVGGGGAIQLELSALMRQRATIRASTLRARSLEDKAAAARAVERHVLPLLAAERVQVPVAATFALRDAEAAYERFAAAASSARSSC